MIKGQSGSGCDGWGGAVLGSVLICSSRRRVERVCIGRRGAWPFSDSTCRTVEPFIVEVQGGLGFSELRWHSHRCPVCAAGEHVRSPSPPHRALGEPVPFPPPLSDWSTQQSERPRCAECVRVRHSSSGGSCFGVCVWKGSGVRRTVRTFWTSGCGVGSLFVGESAVGSSPASCVGLGALAR